MKRILAGFILLFGVLHAEPRTFTDQFGRTITAELLSVENGSIRIRRDDGQIFTLTVSKLTDDDQKFIAKWQSTQPNASAKAETKGDEKFVADPSKIVINLGRGKFSSTTLSKWEGYTHKHEQWGYNITMTNQHLRPIQKIRIEYNLFARTFSDVTTPMTITGTKSFDAIGSRASEVFRTGSAEVCRQRGIYFGESSGEMRGIWLRIYVDNELLIEQSTPESLMKNEKWTKIRNEDA